MSSPPAPTEKRRFDELDPEVRVAAAAIFQAFKEPTIGPQCQREEAEAWLRSETAAQWLSLLELPLEDIECALKNLPEHRYRSSLHFDPGAARKAYETSLKRGNRMKARKR